MNRQKIILIATTICFFVLILSISRFDSQKTRINFTAENYTLASIGSLYLSNQGNEAEVMYYSDNTAKLTIIGTEYKDILLDGELDATGIKYVNNEKKLVLWDKSPEIKIIQDEEIIFEGKDKEIVEKEDFVSSTWVWKQTYNGVGPQADISNPISPIDESAFTLKFSEELIVSGTTDCNDFGGSYKIVDGKISFSELAITRKACSESQEDEFVSMIKDGKISWNALNLYLEHDQTVVFEKE